LANAHENRIPGSVAERRRAPSWYPTLSRFDLHEPTVEDAQGAHQRPKIEGYGATPFVVTVGHGKSAGCSPHAASLLVEASR
jgi:hypothetical protein